ncbi:MAG: four helix bundle protein [Phycisphaerae bacterium]|nr:four helix bundle protein [Phycisphaerae bacterium]
MAIRDFKELKVWQKSHDLVLEIYKATKSFPREELYSLTSQLKRAVVSVPGNIAEGAGRNGKSELKHFMTVANGSLSEAEYYVLLSLDLEYISKSGFARINEKIIEVKKMLSAYIRKVEADLKCKL